MYHVICNGGSQKTNCQTFFEYVIDSGLKVTVSRRVLGSDKKFTSNRSINAHLVQYEI